MPDLHSSSSSSFLPSDLSFSIDSRDEKRQWSLFCREEERGEKDPKSGQSFAFEEEEEGLSSTILFAHRITLLSTLLAPVPFSLPLPSSRQTRPVSLPSLSLGFLRDHPVPPSRRSGALISSPRIYSLLCLVYDPFLHSFAPREGVALLHLVRKVIERDCLE